MYRDHQIVLIVISEEPDTLDVVLKQSRQYADLLDRTEVWCSHAAIDPITDVCASHECAVRAYDVDVSTLYATTCQVDTVYFKIGGDVMLVDSQEAFSKLLDFRIDNPGYFLTIANIANNPILAHLQQRQGLLPTDLGVVGYHYRDAVGRKCLPLTMQTHHQIRRDGASSLHLDAQHILFFHERMDLDAVCWLGSEFAGFHGHVPVDHDEFLSVIKPRSLNRPNIVFAAFVVAKLGSPDALGVYRHAAVETPLTEAVSVAVADVQPVTEAPVPPSISSDSGEWWTPTDDEDETAPQTDTKEEAAPTVEEVAPQTDTKEEAAPQTDTKEEAAPKVEEVEAAPKVEEAAPQTETKEEEAAPKVEEVKTAPKVEEVKAASKAEEAAPQTETKEEVKTAPKVEEVKAASKAEEAAPQTETKEEEAAPKVEEVKAAPKAEEVKAAPKAEEVKAAPKAEEVKAAPKAEEAAPQTETKETETKAAETKEVKAPSAVTAKKEAVPKVKAVKSEPKKRGRPRVTKVAKL